MSEMTSQPQQLKGHEFVQNYNSKIKMHFQFLVITAKHRDMYSISLIH